MPTVLIAENEVILAKMYKFNIEQAGLNTAIAMDGQEAIDALDKSQPDLLILDLLMPKVDGFGVLEYIRKKKYTFPVIVLSNLNQAIDKAKCQEFNVAEYFVKSELAIAKLIEKIQELVGS